MRLALEVDQDDVLGLVVIELGENGVLEIGRAGGQSHARAIEAGTVKACVFPVFMMNGFDIIHLVGRVGNGVVLRIVRGRGGQRRAPGW
jgi:hypothetical protein